MSTLAMADSSCQDIVMATIEHDPKKIPSFYFYFCYKHFQELDQEYWKNDTQYGGIDSNKP